MVDYFSLEIGICRAIMTFFGIWPKERNFTVYVRFMILIGVMIGFCSIPQTVRLFKVKNDFDELLDIITNCDLTVTFGVICNVIFWYNRRALGWLVDAMATDWQTTKAEKERKLMLKNTKIGRFVTTMVIYSFESSVFSLFIVNAYNCSKEMKLFQQGKVNASDRMRPLYLRSEFPYDIQKTPYYEITWFLQFLTTLFAATTFSAITGFFTSLVLHLCAQMKNLRGQFQNLMSETSRRKDKSTTLNLSEITERHKFLMSFAQTIEDVYNVQFFVQLLASILIFCLNGYQIVKIITSDAIFLLNLIYAIYYYFCFASSLFAYCLLATLVSTESTKIRETAYNIEWYELPPADARLLILIMIRTRKPFELTAGKFVALSLELYCSVVKTSGGYLSMLIAMNDRLADN